MPDTGDLAADLHTYLSDVAATLSQPRSREVLGALIAEAASDPELAEALRSRVGGPRRAELMARLQRDAAHLRSSPEIAVEQLVGPVYHQALLVGRPADEALVRAVIDSVVTADDR